MASHSFAANDHPVLTKDKHMKRLLMIGLLLGALGLAGSDAVTAQDMPRFMVIVEERVDGQPSEVSSVAAKIEEEFLKRGYRLVDKSQFDQITARDIALAESNPARARELGMRYGAELVITGKAETSFDAEKTFYGVVNYEFASKGTARLIITDTGELIAVVSKSAKKSATGMSSAANLSLQVLGSSIAEELLARTTAKLAEMSAGPRILQVAFVGIDNLVVLDYETRLVREVPIIKALKIRYLEKDVAVYEATVTGTLEDLRKALSARSDLAVIGFTGNRLDVTSEGGVVRANTTSFMTSPLEIVDLQADNIFPSNVNYYARHRVARVSVKNTAEAPIRNVKVSLFVPGYMALPSEQMVNELAAGASEEFDLSATFNAQALYALNATTSGQAKVELTYLHNNREQSRSFVKPVTIYSRNTISWSRGESVGSFITETDDAVVAFSRHVVGAVSKAESMQSNLPQTVTNAIAVWSGIRAVGISYVSDPWKSAEGDVLDQIQYPRETLASKTGDCDDSSVLLASCLENIGIRTKLVGTEDHVFLMFDTGVKPKNAYVVSLNEADYVVHEKSVWIPLETTLIRQPFLEAWKAGADEYASLVREKRLMQLIDVRAAKELFPPVSLPSAPSPAPQAGEEILRLASDDVIQYRYGQSVLLSDALAALRKRTDQASKNEAAMLLAKTGDLDGAMKSLSGAESAAALNTTGNIQVLKNDLAAAQESYQKALALEPNDGGLYLNFGLARYLAGSADDAAQAFEAAVSKFTTREEAYAVLGLDEVSEALGTRGEAAAPARVAKADIFALLNRSLEKVPDRAAGSTQANRVRERYKNEQNRYVFGGRRGADPTQIASIKDYLYWKH